MTKIETYRLLHRFFMENGVLQKFCNNVIMHNGGHGVLGLKGKSAKVIIGFVINQCCDKIPDAVPRIVWDLSFCSFVWEDTKEGHDFWLNLSQKWRIFLEENNFNGYEKII